MDKITRRLNNIGKEVIYINKNHPYYGRKAKITGFRGDFCRGVPYVTLSDGNSIPGSELRFIKEENKKEANSICKEKVTGFSYPGKPFFEHDCLKCQHLFSIVVYGEKNKILKKADIYRSCVFLGDEYIVRYSSEGSDYATCNLNTIFAYYVVGHFQNLYI